MALFFRLVWVLEVPAHCRMSGSGAMSGNMTTEMPYTLRRSWRSTASRRPRADFKASVSGESLRRRPSSVRSRHSPWPSTVYSPPLTWRAGSHRGRSREARRRRVARRRPVQPDGSGRHAGKLGCRRMMRLLVLISLGCGRCGGRGSRGRQARPAPPPTQLHDGSSGLVIALARWKAVKE